MGIADCADGDASDSALIYTAVIQASMENHNSQQVSNQQTLQMVDYPLISIAMLELQRVDITHAVDKVDFGLHKSSMQIQLAWLANGAWP